MFAVVGFVFGLLVILAVGSFLTFRLLRAFKRELPESTDNIPPHSDKNLNWKIVMVLAFVYAVLISTGWYYTIGNLKWWILAIAFCFFHFLGAIRVVDVQERAVAVFLGLILGSLDSGPHIIPWPARIRKVTKTNIILEFGTIDEETREKYRRSGSSQAWFVDDEPIRTSWGDASSAGISPEEREQYVEDPGGKPITTDPHFLVVIKISNLINLIREVGGFPEARELIKGTCISALQEIAGGTFLAKARKETGDINKRLREKVEELVHDPQWIAMVKEKTGNLPSGTSWGVDVVRTEVKSFGIPRRTNEAMAEGAASIARASGEARAIERKGIAEKNRQIQDGLGKEAAIKSIADGNAHKFEVEGKAIAEAIAARAKAAETPAGQLILKTDALKAGLEFGKAVIVPVDMTGLTGILSSVTAVNATGGIVTSPTKESKSSDTPPTK